MTQDVSAPIEINASGAFLTPLLLQKGFSMLPLTGLRAFLTPLQKSAYMQRGCSELLAKEMAKGMGLIEAFHSIPRAIPSDIERAPVFCECHIPPDEVWFKNIDGDIVVKIVNLKIPGGD